MNSNVCSMSARMLRYAPAASVNWVIPVLIAAVDPAAEAKLDG